MFENTAPARRFAPTLLLGVFLSTSAHAQGLEEPRVLVVALEDQIIQPVTARFLTRAIRQAVDQGNQCVIIQLDTPGGRWDSTRNLVKEILTSEVPVVVYVAPSGARADSAGLFVCLAAHLSAMAPGTSIGAGTPFVRGDDAPRGGNGEQDNFGPLSLRQILSDNITGDTSAWARALADYRHRNPDWITRAVRDNLSLSAKQAREEHVVDFLAADLNDLLLQLDGRQVSTAGRTVVLRTKGAAVERLSMSWPERLLSSLANPTLAYLLLLLGFAGVMFELTHPGIWIPGLLGLACLILSFCAMQMLPINYAGLALILLGLLLVGLEVKVHSYGILTTAGIASLLLGSAMLIEPVGGVERVSWLVVAPVTVALALILLLLLNNVVRTHKTPVRTGVEALIGAVGKVNGELRGQGFVYVAGELWQARCEQPLQDGESVRIQKVEGLTLYVKPMT